MIENYHCPSCLSEFNEPLDHCIKCGYPFSGTEQDKAKFIGQQLLKKRTVDETKQKVKNARIILFVIGVVNIVAAFFRMDNPLELIFGVVVGIIFVGLGFLTSRSLIKFQSIEY